MGYYNKKDLKIAPSEFQHPADKAATEKILALPVFKKALQFISKNSLEKQMGIIYRSSLAQVTPRVSPMLFQMIEEAGELYGTEIRPDIYLNRTYQMNIQIMGIEKPMLMISSQYLEQVSEESLWGMIASEVAGIRNGFCEIKFVEWLCRSSVGLIPSEIAAPLEFLFRNWNKYVEYSYDRANLVATGNINTTMQSILCGQAPASVLRSVHFDDPNCEYMKQCREFLKNDGNIYDRIRDYQSVMSGSLYYAARYMSLFQFYQTQYQDLIEEYMD